MGFPPRLPGEEMRLQGCPKPHRPQLQGGPQPHWLWCQRPPGTSSPITQGGGDLMAASTDPTAQTASSQTARTPQHQQEGTTRPQNPPTGPQNLPVVLAAPSWLEDQARAGCHGSQGSLQPLPRPGCTPGRAAPHISGLQAPKSHCSPNNRHQCPHHNCTRVPPAQGHLGSHCHQQHPPIWGQGGQQDFGTPSPKGCSRAGKMFSCAGGSDGCSGTQLLPAVLRGRWLLSRARSFSLHSAKFMAGKWAPISFLILGWGGK